MPLHADTFEYLKPTDEQLVQMKVCRDAAAVYARMLTFHVPDGPDKTYLLRKLREVAMWANTAIAREADGSQRPDEAPAYRLEDLGLPEHGERR